MPRALIDVEKPTDPDILQFVTNLAVADARRDHLRETGQLDTPLQGGSGQAVRPPVIEAGSAMQENR